MTVNGALGDLIPLAVGVAISPFPIIAVILMLLAPKAGASSAGFLVGWLAGIVIAVTVFLLIGGSVSLGSTGQGSTRSGWVRIVLGVVLLLLALRRWRKRGEGAADAPPPKWMSMLDKVTGLKAIGLGLAFAAINPKNLILGAAAGVVLASAGLSTSQDAVAIALYTLLAGCTVLIPVLAYALAKKRMRAPLDSLHVWLQHNNSVIMAVLLVIFGAMLIGKGLQSF